MPTDQDSSRHEFIRLLSAFGVWGLSLLAAVVIVPLEPAFEKVFSIRRGCAYAEEATSEKSAPQEYKLPKELKMPKITPAMKKFREEIGVIRDIRDGKLYYEYFRKKTTDGLYEKLPVLKKELNEGILKFDNKEVDKLKNEAFQSIIDTVPQEIIEGIKASSEVAFQSRILNTYAKRIWDEKFVPLLVGVTEFERQQLMKQQQRLLAEQNIDLTIFRDANSQNLRVIDVSNDSFNFANVRKGKGMNIKGRYKLKLDLIKIMMTEVIEKHRAQHILAMVSFPNDPNDKRVEPIRTNFYEYTMNNPVARNVTKELNANQYATAFKLLNERIKVPTDKWVVQSPYPPVIIIKNPHSKHPKIVLSPSDDPELIKWFRDKGIIAKEPAKHAQSN